MTFEVFSTHRTHDLFLIWVMLLFFMLIECLLVTETFITVTAFELIAEDVRLMMESVVTFILE